MGTWPALRLGARRGLKHTSGAGDILRGMTEEPKPKPKPGSQDALDQGCICAVLDNNHGKFPPWPPDGWWITGGCPVHDPENQPVDSYT